MFYQFFGLVFAHVCSSDIFNMKFLANFFLLQAKPGLSLLALIDGVDVGDNADALMLLIKIDVRG